jgi:hypothetical protein
MAAVVGVFASGAALADVTKDQCVGANAKAQDLRREGKLSAAREQLLLCADRSCPEIVRDDCTKRLDDLERAQPTVAFEVKDAAGLDVTAVRVSVDGQPLAERLVGTALPVDIGEHVFTFEVSGQAPISRTLVITEGEKGRRERIVIGGVSVPPPSPAALPAPAELPVAAPPPSVSALSASPAQSMAHKASVGAGLGTQRILGLVGAGVGAAGIAVGTVFGLMTISQKNQQVTDCGSPGACNNHAQAVSDHSSGMTDGAISTAAFIAGGALLAGGAALFFTADRGSERPASASMLVAPSVGPGGGGISVRGKF